MNLQDTLQKSVQTALQKHYAVNTEHVEFQETRKNFEGDITLLTFPFLKQIKDRPEKIGAKIGAYLKKTIPEVADYNVVRGFLNLILSDTFFVDDFYRIFKNPEFGFTAPDKNSKTLIVEYSSPNTNKPLHLGHIRNNLLGYSISEILKAAGNRVCKTQIINDRGIHICKSMLAYQKFGKGETPKSSGVKGDKLIGNYYVKFEQEYRAEISELVGEGMTEEEAKKKAPLIIEAQKILKKWEAGNPEIVALWKKMNQWVYEGFEVTYKTLGVNFDKNYYESDTYLLGKEVVQEGLKKGVFFKKPDGSVWIDLADEGLDEKIVLRADGTAVYVTQDIGTAIQRMEDYPEATGIIYTVGNEQDYHFKVLFLILKKLGFKWADNLYHLSYGMVDLPKGKMKSREGTVVDADELLEEMTNTARTISQKLSKLEGYTDAEKENLYRIIGVGALKYFILKVNSKKSILFNPKESIDFNGNTGPFIQYAGARIQSLLRKTNFDFKNNVVVPQLHSKERKLLKQLQLFPEVVQDAAQNYNPSLIANYTYELVKGFNSFYQSIPILSSDVTSSKIFRIQVSYKTGEVIRSALGLLGIKVPERM